MGWLSNASMQAMRDHADSSPQCAGGEVTARTMKDRRTVPPTVTQDVRCDTCQKTLR